MYFVTEPVTYRMVSTRDNTCRTIIDRNYKFFKFSIFSIYPFSWSLAEVKVFAGTHESGRKWSLGRWSLCRGFVMRVLTVIRPGRMKMVVERRWSLCRGGLY